MSELVGGEKKEFNSYCLKKTKKSSLTKLFYQVVTGMYNRRENKRKTVHETAHKSYLAKRNKTKLNNGNTGCYIQFLSSKYKLHMRMFLPQSKKQNKAKVKTFSFNKNVFSSNVYMICKSFSFSQCVSGRSVKPEAWWGKRKVHLGMWAGTRRRDEAELNEAESWSVVDPRQPPSPSSLPLPTLFSPHRPFDFSPKRPAVPCLTWRPWRPALPVWRSDGLEGWHGPWATWTLGVPLPVYPPFSGQRRKERLAPLNTWLVSQTTALRRRCLSAIAVYLICFKNRFCSYSWENKQRPRRQRSSGAVNIFLCRSTELWPKYQSMCWSITSVNYSNHNNYCDWWSPNLSNNTEQFFSHNHNSVLRAWL